MKKFFHEFKEFAMRGSVVDLAVGVIIGGAFQKIINSLVTDILAPLIGLFAKNDFSEWSLDIMGVSVMYGSFITQVLNFIIMAFVIFVMVKFLNRLANIRAKEIVPELPNTKKCPYCMTEIDINAVRCPNCTSVLNESDADSTGEAINDGEDTDISDDIQ